MKLFFLVLNAEEYLEEILTLFLELGVPGATLIDSVGMGHILAHDIPIFAGLRTMLSGNRPYNKTIFSVMNDDMCELVQSEVQAIMQEADHKTLGVMFTLSIDNFINLNPSRN